MVGTAARPASSQALRPGAALAKPLAGSETVAVGLILLGLAKLVAAAMWKAGNGAATCWP